MSQFFASQRPEIWLISGPLFTYLKNISYPNEQIISTVQTKRKYVLNVFNSQHTFHFVVYSLLRIWINLPLDFELLRVVVFPDLHLLLLTLFWSSVFYGQLYHCDRNRLFVRTQTFYYLQDWENIILESILKYLDVLWNFEIPVIMCFQSLTLICLMKSSERSLKLNVLFKLMSRHWCVSCNIWGTWRIMVPLHYLGNHDLTVYLSFWILRAPCNAGSQTVWL